MQLELAAQWFSLRTCLSYTQLAVAQYLSLILSSAYVKDEFVAGCQARFTPSHRPPCMGACLDLQGCSVLSAWVLGLVCILAETSLHGCRELSAGVLGGQAGVLTAPCMGAWLDLHPCRDLPAWVLFVASMGAETSQHPCRAEQLGAKHRGFSENLKIAQPFKGAGAQPP